ncbi:MAG: VOC family protein [Sulfobacillus sp.]
MASDRPDTFIDHVDLRVRNLDLAVPFYDTLMSALGMRRLTGDDWNEWVGYAYEEPPDGAPLPSPFFGLIKAPDHCPSSSRLAFSATSPEAVDRIAKAARDAGAIAIEGPEFCIEYSPSYYAVFSEDMDGNRFEVCCRAPSGS